MRNVDQQVRAIVFLNSLTLGGTEKAACAWAGSLARRTRGIQSTITKHQFPISSVSAVSLTDGPRRSNLEQAGVPLQVVPESSIHSAATVIAEAISGADVIHAHAPGFAHSGDILGAALGLTGRRIPVVQTNIFGKLENPKEEEWTKFRLFISWTSCVQAARRAGRKVDLDFFRRQSVAVYPVAATSAAESEKLKVESEKLRGALGLQPEHVLFGRFSRPEPNKWTPLVLEAFLAAHLENPNIRLLLREPPPEVASAILNESPIQNPIAADPAKRERPGFPSKIQNRATPILILPATSDPRELAVSQMACDVILHTSSIGESFGYGLAEPMALGKPVITNSVPWHDQAQIELVRHEECGLIASTVPSMRAAILRMAASGEWRVACGESARSHVLSVADFEESTNRVEMAMQCAIEDSDNPLAEQDLEKAVKTAEYLDKHQWGHSPEETLWLKSSDAKIRFLRWQRQFRNRLSGK